MIEATDNNNPYDNGYDQPQDNYHQPSDYSYDDASYNPLYESPPHQQQQQQQLLPLHRRIPSLPSIHRRVTTRKSPVMQCFYRHIPISLCLDTGAESNLISEKIAKSMGIQYSQTDQGALQADEKTPLQVIGEVSGIKINKGAFVFTLDALVVKDSMGYIVAGEPFLEENDVAVRPAKRIIIIQGRETIPYASL